MLRVTSFEAVHSLGKFLRDSGYDVAHLGNEFGLEHSLHAKLDNLEPLLYRTSGDTRLHSLARLFFVGVPVAIEICRSLIPEEILTTFLETGALKQIGAQIEPQCLFVPFANLLAVCDTTSHRKDNPDLVVGPSLATKLISRVTLHEPSEATLDIGTGSGILALEAASYSKRVVATDINCRAVEFATFGAALNGITNLTAVCGDAFAPVTGQRFSRIIANPPFFITPGKKHTYSDSPIELDGFCRQLAKEAPHYLEEGGVFQMLCEWAQVSGQPWQDRIRDWVAESSCDVLVLKGMQKKPADYAETRVNEAVLMHGGSAGHSFNERISYFQERGVESIVGGVIIMRKRAGSNWVSIISSDGLGEAAGYSVRERFDALDFVSSRSDAEMLNTKFLLSTDAVLEQRQALTQRGWQFISIQLVTSQGLLDRLNLDETVAKFIPLFDGSRKLIEIAESVSASLEIPTQEAEQKCLQLVRRLLQGNFAKPL
ncbi:MAG: methyltransferase [Acidobacteriaceae bacterium]|nr:methyltransferase [Acidobacteriaceae bacterium]MBV9765218.1 methyltransferase [Acidobacteriaceae bacterium]